jgi:hypothetical protein
MTNATATAPRPETLSFRYFKTDGSIVEGTASTLEVAILRFRVETKRRSKADRAERGSFEYKIGNGEWLKA